ncbi:hypothetical protein F4604DRAFT_1927292 [Suillus subluteus]|nr:hypothetical protein F4604DRAFT_1927292 [Suillus subluteus]
MTGNDSQSDEEAPKHLPLNEEEVAVLEGYLKQWKSTLGAERNVVWEDATKEARVKAPAMKPELLRSRKNMSLQKMAAEPWGKKEGKPPINLGRKWTYRSVVESLRKRELLKKIKAETGAKPREPEMMTHYAKYLTEMVNSLTKKEVEEATEMAAEWNKQGIPPELQADMARRKGEDILRYIAKEMFKKAGMRLFMMSAWKNEEGKLMVSSHDCNEEFSNGESFIKTCDWKVILLEWEGYVAKQFDGDVEDETLVKKGRKDNTYTLEIGATVFPILPDHVEMDSDTRKAVVWAFLNWHYYCSGKTKDPVPWKEVIPHQEELIPPPYLPEGRKIREPSRMNRNEATELLDFWYNTQQTCQDITFEFYGWWSKADKEVKPPKKSGGKGKTRKRPGQKSTAMVDDSSHSSEEDNILAHRQKLSKKTAKKPNKSRSRVYSEESSDGFSTPNSSDKSSDDEMPATGKGKAPVKDKTEQDNPPVTFRGLNKALERAQEPSASRVLPTASDIHRRVGPASRPGGALRCKPGDHSKAVDLPSPQETTGYLNLRKRGKSALQSSPEKRARVQTKGKKHPAEDPLDGSPAKRTRSKTADTLLKRAKKPNSRYAANFIRS